MFKRRLGVKPDLSSAGASGCPDLWELESGDIAVIGIRKTATLRMYLPKSAKCGIDEEIVLVPRSVIINAKNDIVSLV